MCCNKMKLTITDAQAMQKLGRQVATHCPLGSKLYLQGELGAGKTTFIRGFLRGKDYQGKVKSPTYTLVEPYKLSQVTVFHFDLYRINDPLELEAIGLRDYFDGEAICLVEWPEQASELLGIPDVLIRIDIQARQRELSLQANTEVGSNILKQL